MIKNLLTNAGDIRETGLIPGVGRSPGVGNGNPLQYSFLENPVDRGAWCHKESDIAWPSSTKVYRGKWQPELKINESEGKL